VLAVQNISAMVTACIYRGVSPMVELGYGRMGCWDCMYEWEEL